MIELKTLQHHFKSLATVQGAIWDAIYVCTCLCELVRIVSAFIGWHSLA